MVCTIRSASRFGRTSRKRDPLPFTRLAHAELNAIARLPTDADHSRLTLWTTQHSCSMCAAAIVFTGVGVVRYIADAPSDHASPEDRRATRADVPYAPLGDPFWWLVANVLFLSVPSWRSAMARRPATWPATATVTRTWSR